MKEKLDQHTGPATSLNYNWKIWILIEILAPVFSIILMKLFVFFDLQM